MAMTDEQLIADLLATFPGIHAKPAREYGRPEYQEGVWLSGDAAMPDGEDIFCYLACPDPDTYNGTVHIAFEAWLEQRGYSLEWWDDAVYFAVPVNGRLL